MMKFSEICSYINFNWLIQFDRLTDSTYHTEKEIELCDLNKKSTSWKYLKENKSRKLLQIEEAKNTDDATQSWYLYLER